MRMLFEFGKLRRLRYLSHLDLQRFMQRALRRSGLPVAYSQGFNPHAQISFASALAMGQSSICEILDVKMAEAVSREEAHAAMAQALPPDMPLLRTRAVEDSHPKLMALLKMAEYEVSMPREAAIAIAGQAPGFLAETEVMAMRKTKSGEALANIRPMTHEIRCDRAEEGLICARLSLEERATLRPELLIKTLSERAGMAPPACGILRTRLFAGSPDAPVGLFDYDSDF